MFKLDLEKAEETEIKLSTSVESYKKEEEPEIKLLTSTGSSKKQESSRKTCTSALLIKPKPLCESQQTVENSSRDEINQTT